MVNEKKNKKIEIKKADNKSAKKSSELFHSIMAASVKGNPKPKKKG